ncbi:MAG: S9 family peptidase [Bacteroidaceae bacterium]|nr:S9 family peptidase [Bacteroidaceae bacterium]
MKRHWFIALFSMAIMVANAQNTLTLGEVTENTFRAEQVHGVNPLNDGLHYAQISADGKQIVKYSFKTGEEVGVLFDVTTARNHKLKRIDGYIMSPKETHILIQTDTKPIYRRSFTANYYIYTVKNNTLAPLSEDGPQQVPLFSPDGNQIAFVRENNLYLVKMLFENSESQVTTDGKFNEIINGIPDWVNEEEFGYNRAFDFSADSKMLAYIRFDESKVPHFSFPLYKGLVPEQHEYADYPGAYSYKYPLAGVDNSTVSVHTFDIKSRVTRKMDLPLDADGYIPRIKFTDNPDALAIMTLNRHQSKFDVYMANPRSTVCKLVIREEAPQYVKEAAYAQIKFYPQHIALLSERDGYNHLYWYTINGNLIKQVTSGEYEVTNFIGWDNKTNSFYLESNEASPLERNVYRIDAKGNKVCLTPQKGTNHAIFSKNMSYFINTYSDLNTPPVVSLHSGNGKMIKTLVDNEALKDKLAKKALGKRELFSFLTPDGTSLNGWMVKPADFDEQRKYPVIMYQYSGPGSQEVFNGWGAGFYDGTLFEHYLAGQGFIVACVDGRGTGGRGAAFEKTTYLNLGVKEAKDQVEAAIYLGSLPYVDKANIGIWGWSYGGFNTLMAMSEGRPVFKAGVAVAAPTTWRYYDTVYTERFMRTPKENADGYERGSAIGCVDKLSGALLLIHGTADDNVHFRNMMEYSEALVQAGKQFDMQVYANRNHGIFGGNTRHHLLTRLCNHFKEHLGVASAR